MPIIVPIPQELRSALSILFLGSFCLGISSYYYAASLMYPRSTGYLDAQCILGDGFPSTYRLQCGKRRCDHFCCDVKVSVIPTNKSFESFESVMHRRNCVRVENFPLIGSTTMEIFRRNTTCRDYLRILEMLSSDFVSNSTLRSHSFPCKYNLDKESSPEEICIQDSFFCDIVTTFEHEELKEYDKRQTLFTPLFVFLIILGIAIVLYGCSLLAIYYRMPILQNTGLLRRVASTAKPPLPSSSQGFSQFDKDTNENSGSAAA